MKCELIFRRKNYGSEEITIFFVYADFFVDNLITNNFY